MLHVFDFMGEFIESNWGGDFWDNSKIFFMFLLCADFISQTRILSLVS